jgi:hypothetical protein
MTTKTPEEIAAEKAAEETNKIKATRDGIKVTTSAATSKEEENEEENEDEEESENKEVDSKDDNKEALADAKDDVKDSKKTEAELEAEKLEAKTAADKAKIQRRIDREVAKRKVLETEVAELKAKLAANPDKANTLTEEEVESRAEKKATEKALMKEFNQASDRLFNAAVKLDKDFQKKINTLADDIGAIPGHLVGILDDLDNGGDVLVHFTNNPDDAEEIYQLSPARAAVKLAKLSAKIEAEKKPAPKAISKVPEPAETIKGGSKSPDTLPKEPTKNMAEFVRIRAKQAEERRRTKMGLH